MSKHLVLHDPCSEECSSVEDYAIISGVYRKISPDLKWMIW